MLIFDEITALNACDTPAAIWRYALKIARKYGFRATIYACPPPHKRPTDPDTIIRYSGLSTTEFQKFAIDGLIGQGHLTTNNSLLKAGAFRWSDIANVTKQSKAFHKLKKDANILGIDDGWVFPVFGPQARNGIASYGKPVHQALMNKKIGGQFFIFAQMAHLRLCQLTSDLYNIEKPLSKREMQIIAWAAKGKSNSEIGTILGLSAGSIDSYMRRAFEKLGVHDRTSASVKAISMDLVRT